MKRLLTVLAALSLLAVGGLKAQNGYCEVGNGTQMNTNLPTNVLYNYSAGQMVYAGSMLEAAGMDGGIIYGISFNYEAGTATQRYVRVYMYNPEDSVCSYSGDWWEWDMQLVYSGEFLIDSVAGWKTIFFENPYFYDEGDNIGIAVYDYTESWVSARGVMSTLVNSSGLYARNDDSPYYPDRMGGNVEGTVSNYLPNIRFLTSNDGIDYFSLLPVVNAPWTENFSGTQRHLDSTWYTQNDMGYNWKFDSDTIEYVLEPIDGSAYAHIFAGNGNFLTSTMITPIINMNGQGGELSFDFANPSWAGDFDSMMVMYFFPDNIENIYTLTTINQSYDTWQHLTFSLPSCNQIILAFMAMNAYGYGIGIDNISVTTNGPVEPEDFTVKIYGAPVSLPGETTEFWYEETPGVQYSWTIQGTDEYLVDGSDVTVRWNTAGTYNVILTGSTSQLSRSDTLVVNVMNYYLDCFMFNYVEEQTDVDTTVWIRHDADGDGYGWGFDGFSAVSASYDWDGESALHPDNWLVSPAIHIPNNTTAIAWSCFTEEDEYSFSEHYSVLVSTTGTNVADFTDVVYESTVPGNEDQYGFVRLSNYSSQDIHIAFRHNNVRTVGQGALYLDGICIFADNDEEGADGIAEVECSQVKLYPNPATDRVTVAADEAIRNIQVFSTTGALLRNIAPQTQEYIIETNAMSTGAYLLRITTDKGVSNQRLIVK